MSCVKFHSLPSFFKFHIVSYRIGFRMQAWSLYVDLFITYFNKIIDQFRLTLHSGEWKFNVVHSVRITIQQWALKRDTVMIQSCRPITNITTIQLVQTRRTHIVNYIAKSERVTFRVSTYSLRSYIHDSDVVFVAVFITLLIRWVVVQNRQTETARLTSVTPRKGLITMITNNASITDWFQTWKQRQPTDGRTDGQTDIRHYHAKYHHDRLCERIASSRLNCIQHTLDYNGYKHYSSYRLDLITRLLKITQSLLRKPSFFNIRRNKPVSTQSNV